MSFFNFNGQLLPTGTAIISADNPSLRYGEGLFETIKFVEGKPVLFEEHLQRLLGGMKLLHFAVPDHFNTEILQKEIKILTQKNELENARIRLAVYRNAKGIFDYIIEAETLIQPDFDSGVNIGVFEAGRKACDNFSHLKHNNFLVYRLGARYAQEIHLDDAIILNDKGRICDSTKANLFIVKDQRIKTPALSEGCVAGIVRAKLLEADLDIEETILTVQDLEAADEIFLTNSIIDMQWVKTFNGLQKGNAISAKIHEGVFGK